MRKLRADSTWSKVPASQREQVLNWLFDDGLSYKEALKRARKKLGIKASLSSLKRYYRHISTERRIGELLNTSGSVEECREAAWKLIGVAAFEAGLLNASGGKDKKDMKNFMALMKLHLKDRQQNIKLEWLALEQERFLKNLLKKAA